MRPDEDPVELLREWFRLWWATDWDAKLPNALQVRTATFLALHDLTGPDNENA